MVFGGEFGRNVKRCVEMSKIIITFAVGFTDGAFGAPIGAFRNLALWGL